MALAALGQFPGALQHLQRAVSLAPNMPIFLRNLAWVLATHPDPRQRRASEAIRLAQRAQRLPLSQEQRIRVLDTLGAAYAAAGRFDQALKNAEAALELARTRGGHATQAYDKIRKRTDLYRQAKPYLQKCGDET